LKKRGERSTCADSTQDLEKLTRSVNEEQHRKPAKEELLYATWVAQRRKPGLMDVAGAVLEKRRAANI